MMSQMNAVKLLNEFFEETYLLMESIMEDPELCDKTVNGDYNNFKRHMEKFTSDVETKDAWIKDEHKNEESNKKYFETGYHDDTAVLYPFKEDQELKIQEIIKITDKWRMFLYSIIEDVEDDDFVIEATNLKYKLTKLISAIFDLCI